MMRVSVLAGNDQLDGPSGVRPIFNEKFAVIFGERFIEALAA